MTPTIAPAYGPAISPARNAPDERQVGRLVVEQQPRGDAGRQRQAEAGGEDQPVGPVALLGQQDVAEPPETARASSPATAPTASLAISV